MQNISGTKDEEIQRYVEHVTNTLIRTFVELYVQKCVQDYHILNDIGMQVFTTTCKCIFGESFTDYTTADEEEMMKMMEALKDKESLMSIMRKIPAFDANFFEMAPIRDSSNVNFGVYQNWFDAETF